MRAIACILLLALSVNPVGWKTYREKPKTVFAIQFVGTNVQQIDDALDNVIVSWDNDPRDGGYVDLQFKRFRFAKGDWICCKQTKDGDKVVSAFWRESDAEFKERYEEVK